MLLIKRSLLLLLFFTLSLFVWAQSFPTRNDAVATDSRQINSATINQSAESLQNLGADVLVLFVEGDIGRTLSDAERYFDQALEHYKLRADGVYKNNLFAIFIGTSPLEGSNGERPLYIVYGGDLNPLFQRQFGNKELDQFLREDIMIPDLQQGDFTGAITAALEEASRQFTLANNLSQTGSSQIQVQTPGQEPSGSRSGFFSSLWWPVLLVLIILFLVFGLRRRPAGAKKEKPKRLDPQQNLADRESLELILKDLNDNAASTGHDPYLPDDPAKQTDMQLLTRMLKEERPELLQAIEEEYKGAVDMLHELADSLSEDTKTTDFGALLLKGQDLKQFTESLSDRWEDLNLELSKLEEKRITVEEKLQDVYKRYESMRQGDLWPEASKVFKPLIEQLAESDSEKNRNRPFSALAKLEQVEEKLAHLTSQLPRLQTVAKQLLAFEGDLSELEAQGYKPTKVNSSFASAKEQFRVALDLMKQQDYKVLDAQIDEAAELSQGIEAQILEQRTLKDTNLKRLSELEQLGEKIKMQIDDAVPVFEKIQTYAESNWSDIRGNGTEAQKAANRAHELYETARAQNQAQEYNDAKEKMDMAFVELEQAHELIDAIHLRLENLNRAKETSQQELHLVEAEVKEHLAYVQQPEVDRAVSEVHEVQLKEAYQKVVAAKAELEKGEPSWLNIMEQVQAADKMSDAAFEKVRSEKEAMERRYTLMNSEKTEARGALERILKFAHLHPQDITEQVVELVDKAQTLYAQAESQEKQIDKLEEERLAKGLEQAAALFDEAQKRADEAYGIAENSFKEMDALRQQTAAKIADAEANLRTFANFIYRNQLDRVFQSSINQLERSLPGYDARASKEELLQATKEVESIQERIKQLSEEAKTQSQRVEAELRRQRLAQVELERRRRAAERARQGTGWGSWPSSLPPIIVSPPRQSSIPRQVPRNLPSPGPIRLPTARSAPPIRMPSRSSSSPRSGGGRMTGGGWGGSGRKTGGGW
ncbi:MAG: hypothetical protein KC422_20715 [Trueperaceae bacterium]|nr:hypothetical protein [Trueperaceae bacterium]